MELCSMLCASLDGKGVWGRMYLIAQSCPTLCNPMDWSLPGFSVHGDFPGQKIGVGCHAFLQGIFPTQGSNPGLPHWRQILYHQSHQESPRILEWVVCPFSRRSSWPRDQTKSPVSLLHCRQILYCWATGETLIGGYLLLSPPIQHPITFSVVEEKLWPTWTAY